MLRMNWLFQYRAMSGTVCQAVERHHAEQHSTNIWNRQCPLFSSTTEALPLNDKRKIAFLASVSTYIDVLFRQFGGWVLLKALKSFMRGGNAILKLEKKSVAGWQFIWFKESTLVYPVWNCLRSAFHTKQNPFFVFASLLQILFISFQPTLMPKYQTFLLCQHHRHPYNTHTSLVTRLCLCCDAQAKTQWHHSLVFTCEYVSVLIRILV